VTNREIAWPSEYDGTGHLVRFLHDIDVYYNDQLGETFVLAGITGDRFDELGGTGGYLGFPKSEGLVAADFGALGSDATGFYQNFEGGILHTFQINGVWDANGVHGAIQATYNSLPGTGSGSALGFPISEEINTGPSAANPNKSGVYQKFEGGWLYYDSVNDNEIGVTYILYNNGYWWVRWWKMKCWRSPICLARSASQRRY
jgi:uncharacterized protein with LGFP repeats